jgi:hypothetical protein
MGFFNHLHIRPRRGVRPQREDVYNETGENYVMSRFVISIVPQIALEQ